MTYNTSYAHHVYAIKSWLQSLSTYVGVSDYKLGSVVNGDDLLINGLTSINDPNNVGGRVLSLNVGLSFHIDWWFLSSFQGYIDYTKRLNSNLKGVQFLFDGKIQFGTRYGF